MPNTTVYVGDVFDALTKIEPGSINTVVSSPPYWARRRYGDDSREIGQGSLGEWIEDLVRVFDGMLPLLTDDAIVWWNVGDSSSKSGGSGGDYNLGGSFAGKAKYRKGRAELPDGSVLGGQQWSDAPGRLLHALQDAGWWCRCQIVWDKGSSRPEDWRHTRRPGEQHEMVYMLTRSMNYPFDIPDDMVEKGNVWHIRPGGNVKGAKAPMPRALALRCLTLTGLTEGTVLDPFMGSGTTLDAAQFRGLDSIGIDLDGDAAREAAERLGAQVIQL